MKTTLLEQWYYVYPKTDSDTQESFNAAMCDEFELANPDPSQFIMNHGITVLEYPADCPPYFAGINAAHMSLQTFVTDIEYCETFNSWGEPLKEMARWQWC
jgi:hypothetical protein